MHLKPLRLIASTLVLAGTGLITPRASAQLLQGVSGSATPADGWHWDATALRQDPLWNGTWVTALAADDARQIAYFFNGPHLYQYDYGNHSGPTSLGEVLLSQTGTKLNFWDGLTWDSQRQRLVGCTGDATIGPIEVLYEVDPSALLATPINPSLEVISDSLAFNPNDGLYYGTTEFIPVTFTNGAVLKIDPSGAGAVTPVIALPQGYSFCQGSTIEMDAQGHAILYLMHRDDKPILRFDLDANTYLAPVPNGVGHDYAIDGGLAWAPSYVQRSTTVYCSSKPNSKNCRPLVAFTGEPSATGASPFSITASVLINQRNGLLFYGFGANNLPFQGGFLCVRPPITRTPVQNSGGSTGSTNCTGTFSYDMGARILSGADPALAAGVQVHAQYWSRDPQEPVSGTSLTNAVEFTILP